MSKSMTKKQAAENFLTLQGRNNVAEMQVHDKPLLRSRWNDYVDTLTRDQSITETQASTWTNPFLSAKHR